MRVKSRRGFMGWLTGALATLRPGAVQALEAPASAPGGSAPPEPQRQALRDWNAAAGLGVTDDELQRAEAYALGALGATRDLLRPIALDESLEPPLVFSARRQA